jgi:hypothetical protein
MHRRLVTALSLIVSLLTFNTALAQSIQERFDQQAIDRIKEEGLSRSQVMELLSYMSDVYGPRLTGTPNMRNAQEWAKQKLASWGLQNARLEAWGPFGRGWTLEGFAANMVKPFYSPLIAYPKAWSASTKGAVRGEVVYLDAKTEADLEKYRGRLKDAIVLLSPARQVRAHFQPEATRLTEAELLEWANASPPGARGGGRPEMSPEQRAAQQLQNKKWELVYNERPAIVLEPGRGDGGTIFVQGATLYYPPDTPASQRKNVRDKDAPPIIPQAVVTVEHYNRIVRMLAKGVSVQLEININAQYHDRDLTEYNVIAEIPGTDLKDEVVMLGAHYDSWHAGTGATDNAAGSAVVMEAVRIIQSLGLKPRRTIRVALWSGEEQGLLGSRAYVNEHFAKLAQQTGGSQGQTAGPVEFKPDYEKFAGYFNFDNGTGKIRGVYLQGNEAVQPIFRTWLAPFRDMGAATLSIANTGGTDHLSFDRVGLPGFQFIQDEVEYDTRTHHSNMDVYDRIQEEDLKQSAVIMAAFVYNTAMRSQKLPRKPLPGRPAPQSGQR